MPLVLANRVQETATANTTVSFTLAGAVTGFQTFAIIGDTNTTYYSATDVSGNWEVGLGTYSTTGPTLTRTTIYASSNAGNAVTFPGTVNVFVTYPSGRSVNLDASGNVSALGTVSSGTWQGTTVGVAYGGTGVTASSGANSVMLRDANQNVSINRLNQANATTTAAGGTTALTAASSYSQTLIGTGNQTYTMPDATGLTTGLDFIFNNNATGTITLRDYANGLIGTITSGGAAELILLDNSTTAGTWDLHGFLPEGVTFGTNAFNLGTSVISGGTWQGGTIQPAYGGTGLTTFVGANNALYSTGATTLTAGTLPVAAGGTSGTATPTAGAVAYGTGTAYAFTLAGSSGQILQSNGTSAPTWVNLSTLGVSTFSAGTTGFTPSTATSGAVTLAGTLNVANGGTGLTSGTSGGVLYYSASGTLASSGALVASALVIGGGAGGAPSTTTTGTGVVTAVGNAVNTTGGLVTQSGTLAASSLLLGGGSGTAISSTTTGTGVVTALGVNVGTAGSFVVNGGALGTPASGTVTNLTGTASININGTVGATTPNTGAFTSITSTSASGILTRAAANQDGVHIYGRAGGTSNWEVIITPTTLSADRTLTLPDNSGTFLTTGATVTVAQGGTGVTSLTSNNVILGNGTSAVQFVAPGSNGNVLTSNGTTWTSAAAPGATISNDTSTASTLYPTFVASTSGALSTINTSNAKLLYTPSNGELRSSALVASNGIVVNSTTVSANYTIASGTNGQSVGPITVASGATVTVSSGQRWLIV